MYQAGVVSLMSSPLPPRLRCAAEFLYLALGEPIGLLMRAENANTARQSLYAARAASGDPQLDGLRLILAPFGDPQQLAIVKIHPDEEENGPPPDDEELSR